MHADKADKYIILHDTTIDEWTGESVRAGSDIAAQAHSSGFTPEDIVKGLWPAVEEFLAEPNCPWRVVERLTASEYGDVGGVAGAKLIHFDLALSYA